MNVFYLHHCYRNKEPYRTNIKILYNSHPDIEPEFSAPLVVPKDKDQSILEECHDRPEAGDYCLDRTTQKIACSYFWPVMPQDIANHIKRCLENQRFKTDNFKPTVLLRTAPLAQRCEVIAVDLFGCFNS